MKTVHLELLNWGVSAGGHHFYGALHGDAPNGDYKVVKLFKSLTKEEADRLNWQDDHECYHEGATTERWETEEEVVAYAIERYKEYFPGATVLMAGSRAMICPHRVLDGPDEFKAEANQMWERWNQTLDDDLPDLEDEWDALMEEWK